MMKLHRIMNKLLMTGCLVLLNQILPAQNIEKYYVNMPDALNPILSKQNRLELLEYYKAGQGDSILNRLGNKSRILIFDTLNQRLLIKNTASSVFDMKMLTLDDSTKVLGIIRTVCAPVCLSTVEFYDTVWNKFSLQFTMPPAIDWVDRNAFTNENVDVKWVENVLENSFISLSFDAGSQRIIAKNNTTGFLSEEDRKLITPLVKNKMIIFRLEGRKWLKEKETPE